MSWWIYSSSGEVVGPYQQAAIREMISNGELLPNDQVCPEGSQNWAAAADHPELALFFTFENDSRKSDPEDENRNKTERLEKLLSESLRLEREAREVRQRFRRKISIAGVVITILGGVLVSYIQSIPVRMMGIPSSFETIKDLQPALGMINNLAQEDQIFQLSRYLFGGKLSSSEPRRLTEIPGLDLSGIKFPIGGLNFSKTYFHTADTRARILVEKEAWFRVVEKRSAMSRATNRLDDAWPSENDFSDAERRDLAEKIAKEIVVSPADWLSTAVIDFAPEAVPLLLNIIRDKSNSVSSRVVAVTALGEIGPMSQEAVPYLLELLRGRKISGEINMAELAKQKEELFISEAAFAAVGKIRSHPDLVVPVLTDFLTDVRESARVRAAEGLSGFGSEAAPALKSLLALLEAEKSTKERMAGIKAIGKIGPDAVSAIDNLVECLEGHEFQVEAALTAIGEIGADDSGVLSLMSAMISDTATKPAVARAAFRTLIRNPDYRKGEILLPLAKIFHLHHRSEFDSVIQFVGEYQDTRTIPVLLTGAFWLTSDIGGNSTSAWAAEYLRQLEKAGAVEVARLGVSSDTALEEFMSVDADVVLSRIAGAISILSESNFQIAKNELLQYSKKGRSDQKEKATRLLESINMYRKRYQRQAA